MKHWLILAAALSAGIAAPSWADDQPPPSKDATGTAPEAPAPTPKKKKASSTKKSAAPKKSTPTTEPAKVTPLQKGPAIVSEKSPSAVNVRAQPAINSEVITRLKKGDKVEVLDIIEKKAKQDEVSKWAKVALPTNAAVWVNASFISTSDKTVTPKKLNLRSGPGENYSVVGTIPKGTAVKEIETKGDWMKIDPPADSFGFVAAHLLSSEPAVAAPPVMTVASVEPPKPPPTVSAVPTPVVPAAPEPVVTPVAVPPPVAPPAPVTVPTPVPVTPPPPTTPVVTTPPAVPPPSPTPVEPATVPGVLPAPAVPATPLEEVLVKRVVSREGFVKRTVSIQAPTYFGLQSLDSGKMINYLYSPSTNVMIKDYMGQRIIVTGEEVLDERWPNTPVINVETLTLVP